MAVSSQRNVTELDEKTLRLFIELVRLANACCGFPDQQGDRDLPYG